MGMFYPDFMNPLTYNMDICSNIPYFLSKNESKMIVIRLSRSNCFIKFYYNNIFDTISTLFVLQQGEFF